MNNNSITSVKGIYASYTSANIKYNNRNDMAMIYTEVPAIYAGTFTKNKIKAAPVIWDEMILNEDNKISAIVINAGIANAATGIEGYNDVEEIAEYTADKFSLNKKNILIASTGVIGMRLPLDKIKNGIDNMKNSLSSAIETGHMASKAIMTTDTVEKEEYITVNIDDKIITIAGMCKGSGMIHPNMGTMLSFIVTDANINKKMLQKALSQVVDDTYNMISVDGDTSTNDSCLLLANGLAGNDVIDSENENYNKFKAALFELNNKLAKKIAMDGEGATKSIEAVINNARTKNDAKLIAKSIISSSLVKTAICGEDANWGRILCAIGYSNANIDIDNISISFESEYGNILVCKNSKNVAFDENVAKKILSSNYIRIICNINDGNESAVAYGCDLTHKYIDINASYRS